MSDIKRIKNVKFSATKEQETKKWTEVLSKRDALLARTDWTQLPDVPLSEECRQLWVDWRIKLRAINKSTHSVRADALRAIEVLEASQPHNVFINDYSPSQTQVIDPKLDIDSLIHNLQKEYESRLETIRNEIIESFPDQEIQVEISGIKIKKLVDEVLSNYNNVTTDQFEEFKIELNELLIETLSQFKEEYIDYQEPEPEPEPLFDITKHTFKEAQKICINKLKEQRDAIFVDNFGTAIDREISNEKFSQALDYLSSSDDVPEDYPLLHAIALMSQISVMDVCKIIIKDQQKWNSGIAKLESDYLKAHNKIMSATTYDDLRSSINNDIILSKWTLT